MSASTADPPAPTHTSPSSSFRWLGEFLSSSVGAKFLIALTGIALTGFVIVHLLGNLQIFLGRDAMNGYAQSLKSLGPLLWVARGGLLTVFVIHLFLALRLWKRSLDARPVPYKYQRFIRATWTSRTMWMTGLVILAFVGFHLAHFTFGWLGRVDDGTGNSVSYLDLKDADYKQKTGDDRHDVYRMFIAGFRNVPIVGLYLVCMILLGLHLLHGVRSLFQTLGLNHSKYNAAFELLGYGISGAVVAGNVLMPLAVLFRMIGIDVP